jgi:aminocarboxymuconate-semialdehyde decarboxylase
VSQAWNKYGLTAARAHGRPGRERRPTTLTVDIHAHLFVPAAAEIANPHLPPDPRAALFTEETRTLTKRQESDRHGHLTGVEMRISEMDAMGVDVQVISPAPSQCYHTLAPAIAVKAARAVNDCVAAHIGERPERFVGLGTVPIQDGAAAAEELERCMTSLHLKGVEILTNVNGRELSNPAFAAFWAAAERLGAVVMIHPGGFTEPRRLGRFYLNNLIGNPLDTTIALHYLILDGVLERHPNLKLLAAHGGGFLPAYAGRLDHAWGARSDTHGDLPHSPGTYLKRIYVDSVVFTPHQLQALVAVMGANHVLLGTDYPYDMGEYDPIEHLVGTPGLSSEAIGAIAGENAVRLFGLRRSR